MTTKSSSAIKSIIAYSKQALINLPFKLKMSCLHHYFIQSVLCFLAFQNYWKFRAPLLSPPFMLPSLLMWRLVRKKNRGQRRKMTCTASHNYILAHFVHILAHSYKQAHFGPKAPSSCPNHYFFLGCNRQPFGQSMSIYHNFKMSRICFFFSVQIK